MSKPNYEQLQARERAWRAYVDACKAAGFNLYDVAGVAMVDAFNIYLMVENKTPDRPFEAALSIMQGNVDALADARGVWEAGKPNRSYYDKPVH